MEVSEENSPETATPSPTVYDGDDDPVVHEIPVFASQTLADSLFLFQYPLQSASSSNVIECPTAARFKPVQKTVQIDLPLATSAMHYDPHKGSTIAAACNADRPAPTALGGSEEERMFPDDLMDKQTLVSSVPAKQKHYAIGVLHSGELHLTPVCAAVQLRPSFQYLDKGDAAKLGKGDKRGEEEDDAAEEEKKGKTVTVRFARPESEQAKAARLASYKHFEEERAKEKWVSIPVYSEESKLAQIERDCLYCATGSEDRTPVVDEMSSTDYLKHLCPEKVNPVDSNPSHPNDILSMTQLKKMPFKEQVRALLINAKVIQFSQLVSLLDATTQMKEVLELLPQFAWLVRGCWVVKSELLYPHGTCSAHSGIPSEILCKARDYTVYRFTQSRFVKRQDVTSVIKVPNADLNEIFHHLARIGRREGWEFCAEDAVDFISKHPSVYTSQMELWTVQYAYLCKELDIETRAYGRSTSSVTSDGQGGRKRKRSFSNQVSSASTTQEAVKDEPMDTSTTPMAADGAPPVAAAASVSNMGASTLAATNGASAAAQTAGAVRVKAEPMDVSSGNAVVTAPSMSAAAVTTDNASGSAAGQALPLIALVKRVLGKGAKTWRDVRQAIALEQACNPGTLDATVSDQALSKALIVAEAVELPASSETPDTADRLFALSRVDEVLTDKYRPVILGLFAKQSSVSRRSINDAINKVVTSSETREITRLLKDLCVKQGNSWVIQKAAKNS